MSNPLPSMPPAQPAAIPVDSSSGLWDRLTSWASENKAVVYTIAGVAVVVTGAGVVYYLNSDSVCFYDALIDPVLLAVPLDKGKQRAFVTQLRTNTMTLQSKPPKAIQHRSSARRRGGSARRPSARQLRQRTPLLPPNHKQHQFKASQSFRKSMRHQSRT